jgi:hypothetical protein
MVRMTDDNRVETRADPRHLKLREFGVCTERFDLRLDFLGGDTVDVSPHHDRAQRLIDPAPLQQGREERSLA